MLIEIIFVILAVGISVVLHELTHGYVAKYLGDDTAEAEGRLSFNPIVHIDPITTLALPVVLAIFGAPIFGAAKPVPVQGHKLKYDEFGMAIVGVMGPLTNLVLAILGGVIYSVFGLDQGLLGVWWQIFISVNIGFFLFNMLPIPPLDGSRLLYAFAPEFLQDIMRRMEQFGLMIILAVVLVDSQTNTIGSVLSDLYRSIFKVLTSIGQ